jgi:hypothetical protein
VNGNAPSRTASSALLVLSLPLAAVIVDRIAITAGNHVITDSEIDQRIRLTAFENGDDPNFGPAARKTAAERLIDQKLVEHEMDLGQYPRLSDERRASLLTEFARRNYHSDVTALDKALAGYGLMRPDLEADLARQSDLLTFLSVRFRPAVQVTEQDIRSYSQQKTLSLDEFRNQIERDIANQRADTDMEAWLKDQRRRTKIQYLEKDLAP